MSSATPCLKVVLFVLWMLTCTLLTPLSLSMILQGCEFCLRGIVQTVEMESTGQPDSTRYHGAGSKYFEDNDDVSSIMLYGLMKFQVPRNDSVFSPVECWAETSSVIQGYKWDQAEKLALIEFPKGKKRDFYVRAATRECFDVHMKETAEYDFEVKRYAGIAIFCFTQSLFWMVIVWLCVEAKDSMRSRLDYTRKRLCLAMYYPYFKYHAFLRYLEMRRRPPLVVLPLARSWTLGDIYCLNTDGKQLGLTNQEWLERRQPCALPATAITLSDIYVETPISTGEDILEEFRDRIVPDA